MSYDAHQFRRGNIVHFLLKSLPELPPNTREIAMANYLEAPTHGLSAAAQIEIIREVLAVLNHPGLVSLFGSKSQAEVPILGNIGKSGEYLISGQIDRILITKSMVTIVDFKTNRSPPKSESDVEIVYLRQMAAYRSLLHSIYPEREIATVLLWTDGPQFMRLSDQILDLHAP